MIPATLILALATGGGPAGDQVTCRSGELLEVRTLERAEGGPSPAAPDERPSPDARGALHFIRLRCDGRTWWARVSADAPGLRPEDLRPRSGVRFSVAGEKLLLERPDGTTLEAHLVKRAATVPEGAKAPSRHPPE